ncbi:MAG: PQQ-binding-like beta-propeller repeat protein [Spirochaetales bacterium]|nr:PQQ-binding-like beta-propeller repeat protein [Spirochaetales bacterium]
MMKLLIGLAALALGTAGVCFADPGAAMFQNSPERRGTYETKAAGAFTKTRWTFKAGGKIIASPVVSGKLCYVGSGDGVFHALDAASGKERWKFKTGGAIDSTAAVGGGAAYFLSRDGFVYALDAAGGKLRWKFKTGGEKMEDWDFLLSSPCLLDGVLYFGSGDGNLYALAAKSGKKIWSFKAEDAVHSAPAVTADSVYFGTSEGAVYALDRKTGALAWRFKTDGHPDCPKGEVYGSPSVGDGIVYAGARDHTLYALKAEDGSLLFKSRVNAGWIISTPVIKDGLVMFGRTGDQTFYALDEAKTLAEGRPVFAWHYNARMYFFGSGAAAGDTVYFGNFNGRLTAVNLKTGAEKWVFQTEASKAHWDKFYKNDRFQSSSVLSRFSKPGAPFDAQGYIAALFTMGSFISSPFVTADTVYIGSVDGTLYALGIE